MNIEADILVGIWGTPFYLTVTGVSGPPSVSILDGADSPQVTLQPDGSYLVCVTPTSGVRSFTVFILDGANFRCRGVITRAP